MLFSSCSPDRKGVVGNTAYEVLTSEGKPLIQEYDFLSLSYRLTDEAERVLSSTYGFDARPVLLFRVRPYFKGDINEILGRLGEGDSARIVIPVDSLVKHGKLSEHQAEPGSLLTYHLKVNQVITRGDLSDSLLNVAIESLKNQDIEQSKSSEKSKIEAYIKSQGKEYLSSESGIYFSAGSAERLETEEKVAYTVYYTISSLDGRLFETNKEDLARKEGIYDQRLAYMPYKISGQLRPKSGFERVAIHLHDRREIRAVVPSELAYGRNGHQNIPPYTPLIMHITRVD
ncbi:hypothetical protein [Dyadobacter tibetensis]|uniref:hypothetical protein n=1 Tax=Dyadobacter tibetensis TaxID=1211851 RepID=UPI00046FE587|nr:hypothetical protein [Dyadobacter tibetensis]